MTNNLLVRLSQHRNHAPGSFTARYGIQRLVYFEHFQYVRSAIAREKEIKRWTRAERVALIQTRNPTWDDLYLHLTTADNASRPLPTSKA